MDHHDQPQPTSTATNSNTTTTNNPTNPNPNSMLVPKSDVRPLDVLMGRGHFHHGGNARFLRIVAERKGEYVSQKNYADKERIAREVMDRVYDPRYRGGWDDGPGGGGQGEGQNAAATGQNAATTGAACNGGVAPSAAALPGRFLQVVDGGNSDGYRIISGKTVLDKIKMNLRQKPRGGRDAASRGGPGGGGGGGGSSARGGKGEAGGGTKQPRRRSSANRGKRRAADSSAAAAAATSTAGTQLYGKDHQARMSQQLRTDEDQVGRTEEQYLLADMLDGALFLDEDDLDDLRNLSDDSDDDNDEDNITDGYGEVEVEVKVGVGVGVGVGQGVGGGYPGGPPVANGTANGSAAAAAGGIPPIPMPIGMQQQQQQQQHEQQHEALHVQPTLNGNAEASASPQISMPAPTTTSTDGEAARRQQLLNNVAIAHSQARNLMLEHQGAVGAGSASASATTSTAAVPNSLEALGRALFAFFTGVDPATLLLQSPSPPPPPAAAAAAAAAHAAQPDDDEDDTFSARQRQRKRTGMVGGGIGGGGGGILQPDGTPSPSLSASTSPGPSGALSDRLRDAGLPVSLCTVITSLMDATDPAASDRYLSAADAEADLGRMTSNPDRYLWDPPIDRHSGTLYFQPNRLYGRTQQWEQVRSAFDKIIVTQEETHGYLLISGPPGSGKTALVEKLRDSLTERRGSFVWIKFDSQQQENPMTNICRGLDEYFQRLMQGDVNLLAEIGSGLKEMLGPSMAVLKDLIPTLGIVVGGWPELPYDTDRRETYNLILHCLKKLLNAIAHPSHPVIVLFDDLQWSDAASQEIIRMLVTDEDSKAAMFIGCYRDNEVDENHPVAENVGAILMSLVPLATITLRNLDKENVNDLCSDVLHLSPRLTRPLAEALHSKTSGNPMFVRQLMRSLYEEGLLQYSASERRWRWDINGIRTKAVADNAVDLLIAMMRSYGPEVRWLLRVSSCLGFRFHLTAITLLAAASDDLFSSGSEISDHIETVITDGLLSKDGADACRFSHDQIWLAAYSLTPETERSKVHLLVGRQLHKQATDDGYDDAFVFIVTDQLNRGVASVASHAEELEIAELNLKAGEKALSAYLFQPASTYLLQGSALLRPEDWNTEYSLCVDLFSACAEAQLAQGSNDAAAEAVAPVLANARTTDDRIRAREVQILSNIAQTKFQDAILNSLSILQELGIDFSNADPVAMKVELAKTQTLFESSASNGQSILQTILAKPTSTNKRQIGLMRILCCASRAAYVAKPPLMLFVVLRMVQMTLVDDAITAESSYAFAALSFAMSGLGNHNLSHIASKIASALDDRFERKYTNTVVCLLNMSILPHRQPIQACIESFRQSYKDACSVGDRDWARISINQISQMAIGAPERGKSLDDVEKEIRQVLTGFSTQEEGLTNNLILSVLYLQLLLNLKKESSIDAKNVEDPTVLTGTAMNQEEYLKLCEEEGVRDYFRRFYCCRLYLAYLFHQHSLAEEMVTKCEEVAQLAKFCPSFEIITETFYMGLIAAEALQRRVGGESTSEMERWQQLAMNSLNLLTKWAEEGSEWNFLHKADLLRAEIAVATGDSDTAISSYQSAIMGAGKSCYVNEEALSCERAGIFHVTRGDVEEARAFLIRSQSLYKLWGAHRKALDISQLIVNYCA